ncbi:isoleucine--tRNA ligase [candidate division KSB1 bacterium]
MDKPNSGAVMFKPDITELDFNKIDKKILEFWDKSQAFFKLIKKNKNNKKYSFIDGPITANNPMGVHHARGRTYKDIYQRFFAMKGFDQRFQNGFDCQGLWVEVEVEKDLGLNTKKEIEEYGLDNFSKKCRERVLKYSAVQTEQSIKLGQWMDWENSYYTMTDLNIEYIWHFLKKCEENKWLYRGKNVMPWCTRCGTSLSQHEMLESYKELSHKSVFINLPIKGRKDEFFMVWTTTPWTLAANVAVAVHPELDYMKVKIDNKFYILSKGASPILDGKYEGIEEFKGKELLGLKYTGPFDEFEAQKEAQHVVIPWEEVGEEEGTGIVHIAPGCGAEDFELGKEHKLAFLAPLEEDGTYIKGYGDFTGKNVSIVAPLVFDNLKNKGFLHKIEDYTHRYPTCWRCSEELVFRTVEEWFIAADEIRPRMKKANNTIKWYPDYMGKRMEDWLNNMGDWCISRKRYWGLPLPFYVCGDCNKYHVIGSVKELKAKAAEKIDKIKELHKPWIDEINIKCPHCGGVAKRISEVGDCWLDAGIVPFSTMKYLEDNEYWNEWYPAEWISEMRAQVRCWFYAMLFMSVTLEDDSPYKKVITYEKVLDEKGREMHKSWGNAIWFDDAVDKMGGDVIRWLYAKQVATNPLLFGFTPAAEIKKKMLLLWNAYNFFILYANIDKPDLNIELKNNDFDKTDLWILSRLNSLVKLAEDRLTNFDVLTLIRKIEEFFDDLTKWYIRRNRKRFWKNKMDNNKLAAYQTLYKILTTLIKVMSPITPFFTEEMYLTLVKKIDPTAPDSIHLNDFPEIEENAIDLDLEKKVETIRKVINIGLSIRNKENLKVRQPLSEILIKPVDDFEKTAIEEFESDIFDELNIKNIKFIEDASEYFQYKVKLDYKKLGPKLKGAIKEAEQALQEMDIDYLKKQIESETKFPLKLSSGETVILENDEIFVNLEGIEGFSGAVEGETSVVLNITLNDDLKKEGLIRELIRHIQILRKDADFDVVDRIEVTYDCNDYLDSAIKKFEDFFKKETLTLKIKRTVPETGFTRKTLNINNEKIDVGIRKA